MLRKIAVAIVAIAALSVIAMPTEVSARRGGWHGGHPGGHYYGGYGFRRFGYPYYYSGGYGYACWRWVDTAFGPRRVWVCGGSYPYY